LGTNPLRAARAFPAFVVGPVDIPPCSLQRPLMKMLVRLHGEPARVFAPHARPRHTSGNTGMTGRIGTRPAAHQASNAPGVFFAMAAPEHALLVCADFPSRQVD